MNKEPSGFVYTEKGLMKFDRTGRARKNWIHSFRDKSKRFKKDKCEMCGTTEKLTIHHKKPIMCINGVLKEPATLEELKERALDPENCQTLCRSCHDEVHGFNK